jgi:hypothetical protein
MDSNIIKKLHIATKRCLVNALSRYVIIALSLYRFVAILKYLKGIEVLQEISLFYDRFIEES